MSAGKEFSQTAAISFSKANFAREWAWALQPLGTKLTLTDWKFLQRNWIYEIIQWVAVLLSVVLLTSSTTFLQSDSMIKHGRANFLATWRPHSTASASAILTSSFNLDWFIPAAIILPSEVVITAAKPTFFSWLLVAASTDITSLISLGVVHD